VSARYNVLIFIFKVLLKGHSCQLLQNVNPKPIQDHCFIIAIVVVQMNEQEGEEELKEKGERCQRKRSCSRQNRCLSGSDSCSDPTDKG
jgi:hypothetical protein